MKNRLKKIRRNLKTLRAALTMTRKEREAAAHDIHKLNDDIVVIHVERKEIHKKLSDTKDPEKVQELKNRLERLNEHVEQIRKRIATNEIQKKRAAVRAQELYDRQKFLVKKKTVLRKKIKEAKTQANPKWESWMANGYDANVTQGVKDFLARGVVKYDLTVTSMRRTYVPPGGSTTSYHLSGKAGDIAGAKMEAFQVSEFQRNQGNGNCLELFGPNNSTNLRYGSSLAMGEGTALENLHDSHCHGAFN